MLLINRCLFFGPEGGLARLERLDVVLHNAREEEVNLLVPVHCAVILERVVVLPVLLELLFLHFGFVSQLLVLVLILQLQNLVLAVNAVFFIHVLYLLLLWEQHEGA